MVSVFRATIETADGKGFFAHGFHLGTDEAIARKCAEDLMSLSYYPAVVKTVSLVKDGALFDVFDGKAWDSDNPLDRPAD